MQKMLYTNRKTAYNMENGKIFQKIKEQTEAASSVQIMQLVYTHPALISFLFHTVMF